MKGSTLVMLAPSALPSKANAAPQLAQGGRGMRSDRPLLNVEPAGVLRSSEWSYDFRFSPDGKRIAVPGPGNIINVIEFPSGKPVSQIRFGGTTSTGSFAFGADGRTIITTSRLPTFNGGGEQVVSISEADTGSPVADIPMPREEGVAYRKTESITVSPDGLLAVASVVVSDLSSRLVVIDLARPSVINVIRQLPTDGVVRTYSSVCALGPNGILAAPLNRSPEGQWGQVPIRLIEVLTGRILASLPGNRPGIESLEWSADGSLLVTSGKGRNHEIVRGNATDTLIGEDEGIWIWDIGSRQKIGGVAGDFSPMRSVSTSSDGKWIASTRIKSDQSKGTGIGIWQCADGAAAFVHDPRGTSPYIRKVAFSPDFSHLVWLEEGGLRLFRVSL